MNSSSSGYRGSAALAKASFCIYLLVLFFGTSLPFQEDVTERADITTANVVNQYLLSFLYLLSLASLHGRGRELLRLVRTEKFLLLFLLWSLLSVGWSDFPLVSFKRWLQVAGSVLIFAAALLRFRSWEETLPYFKGILIAYVPVTCLSIALVPGAISPDTTAWQGLAEHKNLLGQLCVVSLIVWSHALGAGNLKDKAVALLFWATSAALLVGAQSTTSLVTAGVLGLLAGLAHLQRGLQRLPPIRAYVSALVLSVVAGVPLTLYLAPELPASAVGAFGKDLTFTGRVDLWDEVLEDTADDWLRGCGFGGYWIVDSPRMDRIYEEFPWLPNSAHSGYVDILNETGVVGAVLFALLVLAYFRRVVSQGRADLLTWFAACSLIVNLTESTLFRTNMLTGGTFTFAYLALFLGLIRRDCARATPEVEDRLVA